MRIVCQQTILMKYHALFVIFEKEAKIEIVVCCKLYGMSLPPGVLDVWKDVVILHICDWGEWLVYFY